MIFILKNKYFSILFNYWSNFTINQITNNQYSQSCIKTNYTNFWDIIKKSTLIILKIFSSKLIDKLFFFKKRDEIDLIKKLGGHVAYYRLGNYKTIFCGCRYYFSFYLIIY